MRVLVATDGSPSARRAVDLVASIPWPDETTIQVVEAIQTGAGLFSGPWTIMDLAPVEQLEVDVQASAEDTVEEARRHISRPDRTVVAAVLHGRPATAIAEAAEVMKADLIVVGSRGHGRIETMVLGSVSAEVVDHAAVPVLVARGKDIGRVILAWDGSSCAAAAADLLLRWPIFARSSVRVVNVIDVKVPWWTGLPEPGSPEMMPMYLEAADSLRRGRDALMDDMVSKLRRAGIAAEADGREGDAATRIIDAAKASDAGMIVLGTHGRTGLSRLVLGSVARNVLVHAPCSVLILRHAPVVHDPPAPFVAPGADPA